MDTHNYRLKYGNYSGKSDLGQHNSPLKSSVDKIRHPSKDHHSAKSSAKLTSPQYMTTHLNSVKAKNRRNSNGEEKAKKISTEKFNPN